MESARTREPIPVPANDDFDPLKPEVAQLQKMIEDEERRARGIRVVPPDQK